MRKGLNPRWWGPIGLTVIALGLMVGWFSYLDFTTSNNVVHLPMRQGAEVRQHLRAHDPDGEYDVLLTVDDLRPVADVAPLATLKDGPPVRVKMAIWSDGKSIPLSNYEECCSRLKF